MKKVYIIEDHPIFRNGLVQLINQQKDLEVTGEAESTEDALLLFEKEIPDLSLIDISLKDSNGLELIKRIKSLYPETIILVLSMHDEFLYAERVLKAGARGYIMKHEASTNVLQAISDVLNGKVYISEKMRDRVLQSMFGGKSGFSDISTGKLSDREFEIFQYIGKGFGISEISEKLNLSVKTIETYRKNLKRKLNITNASKLRQLAIQWNQDKE